jgi:hypothetical protein
MELQVIEPGDPVRIDIRFKKFDRNGQTMNSVTPAQNQYRNQLPMLGLGDASGVLRLSVAWRENAAATDLEDVRVIYVKDYEAEWFYSISNADGGEATTPMPVPAQPPEGGTTYRKLTPNKGEQTKRETA